MVMDMNSVQQIVTYKVMFYFPNEGKMFCKLTFELTGQIVTELYSLLCTVFMSILCTRLAIPSDVFVDLGKITGRKRQRNFSIKNPQNLKSEQTRHKLDFLLPKSLVKVSPVVLCKDRYLRASMTVNAKQAHTC